MKNKETIIGWVLVALLMTGLLFYQGKKEKEEQAAKKEKQKTEQIAKAKEQAAQATAKAQADTTKPVTTTIVDSATGHVDTITVKGDMVSKYGEFAAAATGTEQTFIIENDLQKIELSTKGGQIKSVELKGYKTWDGKPLVFYNDKNNSLSYQLGLNGDKVLDTKDMYFEPVGEGFKVTGNESKTFSMRLNAGAGKYFEQQYTLKGNSYMFDYKVNLVGLNTVIPQNYTSISAVWNNKLHSLEKDLTSERTHSALYYKFNKGDVDHQSEASESEEETKDEAPLEWIAYKQQFFNATLFSDGKFEKAHLKTKYNKDDKSYVKSYSTAFKIPYKADGNNSYAFQYYIGPNHFNTLKSFDRDFEEIIKLGPDWIVFAWIKYITRFIIWIFNLFEGFNLNYGIIILIMTLLLKIALHPLTAKSIESAAKMKILAPELAALREKYGDDQTRMGQEQMKLYQRAGVSPFGGCLPLLLQMPILIAMYNFFPASIELRQEHFLWANDLSTYDDLISWKEPVLGVSHISLFTILMTITSVIQAVMNSQMNAMGNQQPGMQYLPYIMPVMLMFVFNSFPAALTYYYLLQNLMGIAHQWIIQKFFLDEEKLRKQIEDNKKNPKKPSGWAKKLADLQKQATEQQQQRAKNQPRKK